MFTIQLYNLTIFFILLYTYTAHFILFNQSFPRIITHKTPSRPQRTLQIIKIQRTTTSKSHLIIINPSQNKIPRRFLHSYSQNTYIKGYIKQPSPKRHKIINFIPIFTIYMLHKRYITIFLNIFHYTIRHISIYG